MSAGAVAGFVEMRTIAAVLLFAAAGISTASAQTPPEQTPPEQAAPAKAAPAQDNSFAMDHGRAAAAAAAAAAAKAQAAAGTTGAPAARSPPANFGVNGNSVIAAIPPLTPEQEKAEAEARSTWLARCRPSVVEDQEGLRRTHYAEPDCDLSRFNTAGQQ
jgi:predicted lipid-binding transport protein (Tim44 family)